MRKRIWSVLMSVFLVLSMALPVYADGTVTITVNNADNATLTYAQLIKEDATSSSGWAFVNDSIAQAFIDTFGVSTAEEALWTLIAYEDSTATVPAGVTTVTITASLLKEALEAAEEVVTLSSDGVSGNTITVSSAGLYLIKGEEEGYTYSLMTAAVGSGDNFVDVSIDAKRSKSSDSITKVEEDEDNLVGYGEAVVYKLTVTIPYIDENAEDRTFIIEDTLPAGAQIDNTEGTYSYTVTGGTVSGVTLSIQSNGKGSTDSELGEAVYTRVVTFDLSSFITANNDYAGYDVEITYQVIMSHSTSATYTNTAVLLISGEETAETDVTLYGTVLTITKQNEGGTALSGAEFSLYDSDGNEVKFIEGTSGTYYSEGTSGTGTAVLTSNSNGKIVIYGLTAGEYTLEETKAPSGYSLYSSEISVDATYDGEATAVHYVDVTVTDTSLTSLPVTGGTGIVIAGIAAVIVVILGFEMYLHTKKRTTV